MFPKQTFWGVGSFDSEWGTMLFCRPAKLRSLFCLKTWQLDIIKTFNLWGEKRPTRDTCCYTFFLSYVWLPKWCFCIRWKWIGTIIDSHFTQRGNIKPPQVFAWHLWFSIKTGVEKLTFASVICPYRGKDFLCVGSFNSKWETMLFCYPAKPRSLFRLKTRQLDIINLWGEKRPMRLFCSLVSHK